MRLTTLSLKNFRNHTDSQFEFAEGTNVLLGDNGQGKTNVIEAISYLCLTKSFYAGSDADVLNFDADLFEVSGAFVSDGDVESKARVAYDKASARKAVYINGQPINKFSEVVGRFPVVISSPDHAPITMGSPSERRKFVDFVDSQASHIYLSTLVEYRKVLKQRNKILSDAKGGFGNFSAQLEPWDEQLVKLGAFIMARRGAFVREFKPFLLSAYSTLSGEQEVPSIDYMPFGEIDFGRSEAEFQELLANALREKRPVELKLGITLAGPHRDEFACTFNGHDLRKYASQGQHKTYLVALKIAEFFYLHERCNEMPILLLDDVFSELDEHRAVRLLEFVGGLSQTFITSTTLRVFDHVFDQMPALAKNGRKFYISHGKLVEQAPVAA